MVAVETLVMVVGVTVARDVHPPLSDPLTGCVPDQALVAEDVAQLLAARVKVRGLPPAPHHAAAAELAVPEKWKNL